MLIYEWVILHKTAKKWSFLGSIFGVKKTTICEKKKHKSKIPRGWAYNPFLSFQCNRLAPPIPASRFAFSNALALAFQHHLPLELSDATQDREHELACWSVGVHSNVKYP
jgi:hypothetical protein